MKILIAEDDLYTRMGLEEIFKGESYDTYCASNGKLAYELFIEVKPDLLCLDIMMPEMNGYEVCKKIRENGYKVPVIFISAKSEEIDKVVGLELGADDFITKPFGVREVLARVKAVLRRSFVETIKVEENIIILGDMEINLPSLQGKRGKMLIDLTPREAKILQLFYNNKGKVLNRDQLYDCGWGQDYLPSSRSLDQFISQLRKKIELYPTSPRIIKTVPTAGYRYP